MAKRPPKRQRKADRLIHGDLPRAEIECDYAVAALDRLAIKMDEKWGIDRLPELVSPETARKYGAALAQVNEAHAANDAKLAAHKAQVCMRGLAAMDAEATKLGHQPATGAFWEYELDGFRFAVLKDDREWKTAQAKRPDLTFHTMREVGLALKFHADNNPVLAEVKKTFPGAQVVENRKTPSPNWERKLNDAIPF